MHDAVAVAVAISVALVGCRGTGSSPSPAPGTSAGAASSAVGKSLGTSAADAAVPREGLVNLLYFTPSKVAVSSKVANPKDFPEHLVDGKPATAWNGKTGDLVGGFVAFRVPKDAHVDHVSLSAGFDATSKTGEDLFLANHRVAQVKVERDGQLVKSFPLDPSVRTPQVLRIDGPGGDYRIVVEKVVPGTKAAWKELALSELAVLGSPGKDRLVRAVLPVVVVGDLSSAPPPKLGADTGAVAQGPYPSVDAFCKAHTKAIAPRFLAGKDDYPEYFAPPYCRPLGPMKGTLGEPFLEATLVNVMEYDQEETRVALRTKAGVFVTKILVGVNEMRNPGCAGHVGASFEKLELVPTALGPALEIQHVFTRYENPFPRVLPNGDLEPTPGSNTREKTASLCRADSAGVVRCEGTLVASGQSSIEDPVAPYTMMKGRKVHPSGEISYE